jgi:transcriptional regulator
MADDCFELPQGTLDLPILKTIALEPQHGWAISERVQQLSCDILRVRQASLYPALHRLERKGYVRARWSATEDNWRAKYCELTARGRKRLEIQTKGWRKLTAAVGQILDASGGA